MTTPTEPNTVPPVPDAPVEALTTEKDERNWAMFCHLSVFLGIVIPFANLVAPLILWQIKKDEMPFVNQQGKEVVNFQITMLLAMFVCAILSLIVIGLFMMMIVGIFSIVVTIMGAIKANAGEDYRYPLCVRFIK